MDDEALNPSVVGRARTGPRYWYVLGFQLAGTAIMLLYLAAALAGIVIELADLMTGVVLATGGLLSVAVYPALFKDAIYVNRDGAGWRPRWWRYFVVGFGVSFLGYAVARTTTFALAPVLTILVLALASALVSAVYLYNRHRTVGTP